jgi:hypothetical protein
MFAIARPINGVTINGNEYLLDENDNIKLFATRESAVDFCKQFGIDPEYIEPSESDDQFLDDELLPQDFVECEFC